MNVRERGGREEKDSEGGNEGMEMTQPERKKAKAMREG